VWHSHVALCHFDTSRPPVSQPCGGARTAGCLPSSVEEWDKLKYISYVTGLSTNDLVTSSTAVSTNPSRSLFKAGPIRTRTMSRRQRYSRKKRVFTILVLFPGVASGFDDKFKSCQKRVLGIIHDNIAYKDIDNTTIWERPFIYTGPIQGLDPHYSREDVLTLTYDGKLPPSDQDEQ